MREGQVIKAAVGIGASVLFGTGVSSAAPHAKTAPPAKRPNACQIAYQTAQAREEAGRLREARELALSCAKIACGTSLMQQCTAMYAQLDSDIPSFVPVVNDESGAPRTDVEV